jgi:hypothetical protein
LRLPTFEPGSLVDRRELLAAGGAFAAGAAALPVQGAAPRGGSDACIFLWIDGGMAHLDTFDPKKRGDGKRTPGSYYSPISTAIPGAQVCEHLPKTARLLDRCALLRSVTHNVDQHSRANSLMHQGRMQSETVLYPSLGSVVYHQLGARTEEVPAYVVLGLPSAMRDPGFLGSKFGYVYLPEPGRPPQGLVPPPDVRKERQDRRMELLRGLQSDYLARHGRDSEARARVEISQRGFRLAGPRFLNVLDLQREPASLRTAYGDTFGQRCLQARRLVEAGARFVEVSFYKSFTNGAGWDTHNAAQKGQYRLIQQLDQAYSTLLSDLEKKNLLDRTLVVLATEFGRPPEFDKGGGRGHHPAAFTCVLAGGGLRTGKVIGATDELGRKVAEHPVSVADFHATIHRTLGIDPDARLLAGARPVPITDRGKPVAALFG